MLKPELRTQLSDSRLFQRVALDPLADQLGRCAHHQLVPGDTLIEAGIHNNTLFLVLAGQLRVYAGGRELPANAVIGAGDCVGEMSLIDGNLTSALVLAAEPSEVLAIPHAYMWEMVDAVPLLARNLLAIMAGRLRNNNLTLVTSQERTLEFEEAGSVDTLTGLHNRHWIGDAFVRMARRCRQDQVPLSLVLIDVDGLSRINDRNGYLTGDSVLRRIARRLAESVRPQDLIGRFGGDVFAVLLPRTPLAEAMTVASRLCATVLAADIHVPPDREPLTVSCGVAPFKTEDDLAAVLARAEAAGLQAKDAGGNCARFAD